MPKAPVHKNGNMTLWENKIRFPPKILEFRRHPRIPLLLKNLINLIWWSDSEMP